MTTQRKMRARIVNSGRVIPFKKNNQWVHNAGEDVDPKIGGNNLENLDAGDLDVKI